MPRDESSGFLPTRRLEALVADVEDGLIVTDLDGALLFMNRAVRNIYGFRELAERDGSSEGADLRDFVASTFEVSTLAGDPVPEPAQPLTRALEGEEFRDVELRLRHKATQLERVFAFSGTLLGGSPPAVVLTIRDVSERVKAHERYRISFETNPAPTMIVRLGDLMLVDVNEGFTELTGKSKSALVDSFLADLGLLGKEDELLGVIDELRDGGRVEKRKTTIGVGAELRDVLVAARPIEIEGQVCGIFTFIDVTELELAQRRLHETTSELQMLHKELGTLNHSAAHDLRTPLRGIDGFSQALLEEYGHLLDERGRRYLDRVRASAARIGHLIDSLLLISQIGRVTLLPVRLDITEMADRVAQSLKDEEPEREVEVFIHPGMRAVGDRALLRILLAELMKNAWHFTRGTQGALIEVGLEQVGDERTYFVRDNGVGFDQAYLAKLFEPFQTVHSPSVHGGPGIGLVVAQRVVQRHEGRIWAEGATGKGAVFRFTLGRPGSS